MIINECIEDFYVENLVAMDLHEWLEFNINPRMNLFIQKVATGWVYSYEIGPPNDNNQYQYQTVFVPDHNDIHQLSRFQV